MPFENVTIEARWQLDLINPETGGRLMLLLVLVSSLVMAIIYANKKQNLLKK